MISYSKNLEDVMLFRALKDIKNGFYIDIGAHDPIVDSVSRAFYEQGWRGVHIEPSSHYAKLLGESRPDEIIIQAAVGETSGVLKYYKIPDSGLGSCDFKIAEQHRVSGFQVIEADVPCITLQDIFESFKDREIHWLKIDVEGYEEKVVKGWGTSKIKPWIVVVESTLPMSQIQSYEAWEKVIIEPLSKIDVRS